MGARGHRRKSDGAELSMSNLLSPGPKDSPDLRKQRRRGVYGRRPEDVEVDIEIGMDQTVTHSDDYRPRNFWMSATGLGGQFAHRLADDLQCMNEGEDQHLVSIEVFATAAVHETSDQIEGIRDVAQPNAVFRPQIAAPLYAGPHPENSG